MDRHLAPAADSQETLISLQQLEPSPIESPADPNKEFPGPPPPGQGQLTDEEIASGVQSPAPGSGSAKHNSNPLGLSRGGHGIVYYLTRTQRYSTYALSAFTTLHYTNTSLIPLITRSLPTSDTYLLLTRPFYQSPLTEPLLLLLPLSAHILSGLTLRLHRRSLSLRRYGAAHLSPLERLKQHIRVWPPVSFVSATGFALVPLLAAHVGVNRVLPLVIEGGSSGVGLGFVAHGFVRHPVVAWTFYSALVVVGSAHIVWGWGRWLGWSLPASSSAGNGIGRSGTGDLARRKRAKRRWWVLSTATVVLAGSWLAGGLGVIGRGGPGEGWVGKGWDELYGRVPFL